MNKNNVQKLIELNKEFNDRMNDIVYIGWGVHSDCFHAFKPYHDNIECLWDYEEVTAGGEEISWVPTYLLWSTRDDIANYFIEQEYKWKEHEIELANRNIKLYTEKIEDCNKIIDGINKIKTELKEISADNELFNLLGDQLITKTNYEMKIGENQYMIDNINSIVEHNIKRIKERLNHESK